MDTPVCHIQDYCLYLLEWRNTCLLNFLMSFRPIPLWGFSTFKWTSHCKNHNSLAHWKIKYSNRAVKHYNIAVSSYVTKLHWPGLIFKKIPWWVVTLAFPCLAWSHTKSYSLIRTASLKFWPIIVPDPHCINQRYSGRSLYSVNNRYFVY